MGTEYTDRRPALLTNEVAQLLGVTPENGEAATGVRLFDDCDVARLSRERDSERRLQRGRGQAKGRPGPGGGRRLPNNASLCRKADGE